MRLLLEAGGRRRSLGGMTEAGPRRRVAAIGTRLSRQGSMARAEAPGGVAEICRDERPENASYESASCWARLWQLACQPALAARGCRCFFLLGAHSSAVCWTARRSVVERSARRGRSILGTRVGPLPRDCRGSTRGTAGTSKHLPRSRTAPTPGRQTRAEEHPGERVDLPPMRRGWGLCPAPLSRASRDRPQTWGTGRRRDPCARA